ncbi:TPA: hypothetical protein ACH3X1_000282 [Trebouxia sp. C0004]
MPRGDKVEQPAASAGSRRRNDKPKGKPKVKLQTGSRRQLHNSHVKTNSIACEQGTSLLLPAGLQLSECLKRKGESMKDDADTDIAGGQHHKRVRMARQKTAAV